MKKNKKKNKISSNKAQENIMTKVTEPYFDKENLAKIVESYFNNGQENVAALDEEMKNTSAQLSKNLDSLNKKISAAQVDIIKPEILKPTDIEESLLNSSDISEVKRIDMSDIKVVSEEWGNFYPNIRQSILKSLSAEKKAELFSILNSQKKYESCIEILNLFSEQDTNKQSEDFIEGFYTLEADKGLRNMNHALKQLYDGKIYINLSNVDQITNILKDCTREELSKVHYELTYDSLVEKMNEVYESCSDKSVLKSYLFINWLKNSTKASTAQTIFLDWARAPEAKELIDKLYSISPTYIKQSVLEIFENKNKNSSDEDQWNNMNDKKKKKVWKTLDKDNQIKYFNEAKDKFKITLVKTIMNDPDVSADEISYFFSHLPEKDRSEAIKDFTLSHLSEEDRAKVLIYLSEENRAKVLNNLSKENHAESLTTPKETKISLIPSVTVGPESSEAKLEETKISSITTLKTKSELGLSYAVVKEKRFDILTIEEVSKKWDSLLQNEQKNILQLLSSEKKAELFSILNSQKKYESCIEILNLCLGQDKSGQKELEDLMRHFYQLEGDKILYNMNKSLKELHYNTGVYCNSVDWPEMVTNILKNCTREELSKVNHELTHENLVEQMNLVYESCAHDSSSFMKWLQDRHTTNVMETMFLDWARAPEAKKLINILYSISTFEIKCNILEIFENKDDSTIHLVKRLANKDKNAIHAEIWNSTDDELKVKVWKTLTTDNKIKYSKAATPELKIKFFKTIMNEATKYEISYFLQHLSKKEDRAEALKDCTFKHLPKEYRADILEFASTLDQWSENRADILEFASTLDQLSEVRAEDPNQLSEEKVREEDPNQLSEEKVRAEDLSQLSEEKVRAEDLSQLSEEKVRE